MTEGSGQQRARALARQIARAFSGTTKSSGIYDWDRGLVCYFIVEGRYRDRALTFHIKISRATRRSAHSPHCFGGTGEDLPPCANCGTPVHVLLTIDTSDAALTLPDLGCRVFRAIYCLNCMSSRPMFVDYSKERLQIIRQENEGKANDDPPLGERPVSLAALASSTTAHAKLGGDPRWLQGPEIPDCTRCGKPMTFFAQLRSLPDLAFGDDGYLYAFLCVECRVAATFIQSS